MMSKATRRSGMLTAATLHKHYQLGPQDLHVLRGVDVAVRSGEWLAITGASGSGKSTLMHLLGGLDRPDRGKVFFQDEDVFAMDESQLNAYRSRHIGFVFQFYHLLPELTALENVLIAAMIRRSLISWPGARGEQFKRAGQLLKRLGLGDRLKHRPAELSGGERQRVAIARALMNAPAILMADEPTGNLDAETGTQIIDLFRQFHAEGQTIVMVTHDASIAAAADRQLVLEAGRLKAGG
jgi:lipoprotein-releasing system ATP-binding protein